MSPLPRVVSVDGMVTSTQRQPKSRHVVNDGTVAAFRAGEPEAVRAVYREYGGLVFAVAYQVLGDRSLAEEASQQAFVQAWRAARSFDPSRQLGPWLATIARRAAIDVHRREAARAHHSLDARDGSDPPSPAASVSDSLDRAYDVWAVRAAIDELPRVEREVVRLQHLEGLTHTVIADQLGIPLGTVKSRSIRAHRRLAGRLGYLREDAG
jgi:RNA polymerase sigma-70 factor (ECF subfamily)